MNRAENDLGTPLAKQRFASQVMWLYSATPTPGPLGTYQPVIDFGWRRTCNWDDCKMVWYANCCHYGA